jgi:hypothetical protein
MKLNRNVVLYVIYNLLNGAGTTICFFAILSSLLFLLTGDVLFVGYAEGFEGLMRYHCSFCCCCC